jgi:hypothetical protein
MRELARHWANGDFELKLFDQNKHNSLGQWILAYEFFHAGELIFSGDDFAASPMEENDSDVTAAFLLGFLSLRQGEVDASYFDHYTPEQIEWRDAHAGELAELIDAFEIALEDNEDAVLPDDNGDDES